MSFENKGSMVATYVISRDPDRSGNYVCDGANDITRLQQAYTDLPAAGGAIYIKAPFFGNGTLTISRSNVTIKSDCTIYSQDPVANTHVHIRTLIIDCTAGNIHNLKFEGIHFYEVRFTSPANEIQFAYFERCTITATSTANQQGIFINSTGGEVNKIWFDDCQLFCHSLAANCGMITVIGATGNFFFNHLYAYIRATASLDWIHFRDNSACNFYIDGIMMMQHSDGGRLIYHAGASTGELRGIGVQISRGRLELKDNTTILHIAVSTEPLVVNVIVHDIEIAENAGDPCTLVNNLNTNFSTDWLSKVDFVHCHRLATGNVVKGTLNESANFRVEFDIASTFAANTPSEHGPSWELLDAETFTNVASVTLGAFTAHDMLLVILEVYTENGSDTHLQYRINNDATAEYHRRYIDACTPVTHACSTFDNEITVGAMAANNASAVVGQIELMGKARGGIAQMSQAYSIATFSGSYRVLDSNWDNPADITSLVFFGAAGNITGYIQVFGLDWWP